MDLLHCLSYESVFPGLIQNLFCTRYGWRA